MYKCPGKAVDKTPINEIIPTHLVTETEVDLAQDIVTPTTSEVVSICDEAATMWNEKKNNKSNSNPKLFF